MFEALRKLIFPIIMIVLLFFVAMIVLEWGLDFTGRAQFGADAPHAAVINGEKIPWEYYQRVLNNLYQVEMANTDEEVSDERSRQLEEQAWQEVLQDRLLNQQAEKHNIVVTDEDIFFYLQTNPPEYVRAQPYFQTDGQFDYQKYVNAMVDPQNAPFWSAVEANVRADLRKIKMQQLVIDAVTVTDQEVQRAILEDLEQVKVNMINASFSKYYPSVPPPTEEEKKAYFEAHKEDYRQQERAVLNVAFVAKQPSEADGEQARLEAQALYDSAMAGVDFAELARTHSDDRGSAEQGGSIGWINQGQTVPEFDAKAFSMQEGEISEPVKSQFGWHIVKHGGYRDTTITKPGESKPEKVRQALTSHILVRTEPSQSTLDGLYNKLQEVAAGSEDRGFETVAKELGLVVEKTPPFMRNQPIQTLGNLPEGHEFAFSAKPGEVSPIFDIPSGYGIAQLAERIPEGIPKYEDVAQRVQNDAIRAQVRKLCNEVMARIHSALQNGVTPEQAAQTEGLTYDTLAAFARTGFVPGLGRPAKAIGEAFALQNPGEFSAPAEHDAGTVIFVLRERISPDLTALTEKRDSVYNDLLFAKQQDTYSRWFENLVERSEIENNVAAANRTSRAGM